ncbi:MAG: ankyrin repeat domain-containing protein [Opitutales bacterium]
MARTPHSRVRALLATTGLLILVCSVAVPAVQAGEPTNGSDAVAALRASIQSRDSEAVKALIADRTEEIVNACDEQGQTILHSPAVWFENQDPRVVRLLIEAGADVNAVDSLGRRPLHMAFLWDADTRIREIQVLLEYGADIDAQDNLGQTALHYATKLANRKAAALLIERGAELKVKDNRGQTPLFYLLRDLMLIEKTINQVLERAEGDPQNKHHPALEKYRQIFESKKAMTYQLVSMGAMLTLESEHMQRLLRSCDNFSCQRTKTLLADLLSP